jgi:hypothetical protein
MSKRLERIYEKALKLMTLATYLWKTLMMTVLLQAIPDLVMSLVLGRRQICFS